MYNVGLSGTFRNEITASFNRNYDGSLGGHSETRCGQGAVKSVYDDWQLRCDTLPGAQHEQCALMRNVVTGDRPNFGIIVF
jgi:invasion protein IalB